MTNLAGHLGGALLLVGVGVLWLMYLVPGWVDRHRARTTKRNAARIEDALSVIAAHQEVSEAVDAEISARSALRLAKQARRVQRAAERKERITMREQEREAARAAKERERLRAAEAKAGVRPGARRGRLTATLVAAAGMLIALMGWQIGAGPWLIGFGVAMFVGSGAMLVRVNAVSARARTPVPASPVAQPQAPSQDVRATRKEPDRAWTPHPLPEPLSQLSHERALAAARQEAGIAGVRAQLDAVDGDADAVRAQLEEESRSSVGALREALSQVTRIEEAESTGKVADQGSDTGLAPERLDEILRRRRVG